jgi:ATP-dependent Clp protease ATP-binding subunit ClpX
MESVRLTFTDDAYKTIACKAILRKTGARGLRSIMESILLDTMFDLPSMTEVDEVVISGEVAEGRTSPLLSYAEKRGGESA